MSELILRVYIESSSITIQAADMETIGHPLCTRTGSPVDKLGTGGRFLPQDQQILLDAVERASEKLKCVVEIIDVSQYPFLKRIRLKGIIPRIEVDGHVMEGVPTSTEIVQFVTRTIDESKTVFR